ncbi:MAG: large conductance mechanosensitive channel protein MscL [Acidimicrobiales bacterium]|jgi:large conductance mechanosensitive channel|nr:large conductance mechanosensitive channel protein MscL [Acidimicrobiales bacterium]
MLKEFKEFILRGNVMDLAVAVIIGAAFGAVVSAFANGILMNLVAALFGQPNFDSLTFSLGKGQIQYGLFLTALVNFLIIAAAMFLVIKAANAAMAYRKGREAEAEEAEATELELLTQIRDALVARNGD